MKDTAYNLQQFFGGTDSESFAHQLNTLLASDTLRPLRQAVVGRLTHLPWIGAVTEIAKMADKLLAVSMPDILLRFWKDTGILNRYVDPENYDPEAVCLIELMKHGLRSEHRPFLEVRVDGVVVGTLGFQIDLQLEVDGIVLKIRDGRIVQIRTGILSGSGEVRCEGIVLAKQDNTVIELPGTIDLGKGIPIAPSTGPATA